MSSRLRVGLGLGAISVTISILIYGSLLARPAHTQQSINAQQTPIQIVSPASGTIISPGSSITVNVSLASGLTVKGMIIVGEDPIGFSDGLLSPPFQFPMTIPIDINPGWYYLTADATGLQGQDLSSTVAIDVEPTSAIVSIQIQPELISFGFVGDNTSIMVLGKLSSGQQITLTGSSLITFSSTNTGVVTISSSGLVTATGPGNATITTMTASGQSASIPVFVPTSIRGDLNFDGKVNQDDLNILLSALNTPANGPNDARDLNHDGLINALDARVLVTLCTLSGCATH